MNKRKGSFEKKETKYKVGDIVSVNQLYVIEGPTLVTKHVDPFLCRVKEVKPTATFNAAYVLQSQDGHVFKRCYWESDIQPVDKKLIQEAEDQLWRAWGDK